jgi:hypothetical protein
MWVTSLVEPWKDDRNSVPFIELFEYKNEAAKMKRLSSKDKVRLARLKFKKKNARMFYASVTVEG